MPIIRGKRIALPGGVWPAAVEIEGGAIRSVRPYDEVGEADEVVEIGSATLLPGIVDTHVHVNEPGRTEWEGFETATHAAVSGGITTLFDMPLNSSPVTTTRRALEIKTEAARDKCRVDVGFWGGVVPGSAEHLTDLLEAGLPGGKCFLVPSGIDEFPAVTEGDLREVLPILADRGAVLLVHAELPGPALTGDRYDDYLRSRPATAEVEAISMMVRLCREYRARVHIVHLSSAEALGAIRAAREEGLPLTVETCPHYLTFVAEEIPDGRSEFKCAPPIRDAENRERLWEGLAEGTIDMVVSDHSPCAPELKRGGFAQAWGGVSSLQFSLPAVWTEARRRGYPVDSVAAWMSEGPARLAGLNARKGKIAPGFDADLVVVDLERAFRVEASAIHHRHRLSPYVGRELRGIVERTYLRGTLVYDRGTFPGRAMGRVGIR